MFDLRPVSLEVVRGLCEQYHGYKSAGGVAVYAFGVYEGERAVAAYAWQPPPPGAAKNICPEAPQLVLALSRMVAVPREERRLKHISKPLMVQMKRLIDRTRWPVLVTYSDEGEGHTGYVYKCSGWAPTERRSVSTALDASGARASRYSNGKTGGRVLQRGEDTVIQRWEHWVCSREAAPTWLERHGWRRELTGRVWRSGNPAHRWVKDAPLVQSDAAV